MKLAKINNILAYAGKVRKLNNKIVYMNTADSIEITTAAMREIVDNIDREGLDATIDKLKHLGISDEQLFERDLVIRTTLLPNN